MSERPSKAVSLVLRNQNSTFWRTAAQCLAGSIAVALITFVCFRLQVNLATAVCLYLVVVVLLSLQGNFLSSAIVAIIASGCFLYFLSPPIFTFEVSDPSEVVVIIVFLAIAAVITHFVSRVRKATEEVREQASLLNLTHDSIFVRAMHNVITWGSRSAALLLRHMAGDSGQLQTSRMAQSLGSPYLLRMVGTHDYSSLTAFEFVIFGFQIDSSRDHTKV